MVTAKAQTVLRQALRLPPRLRADIAATLLHSLDEVEDEGVEEAWAQEVESRLAEVESGRVKLVRWETARRRLWAGLKKRGQGRRKA